MKYADPAMTLRFKDIILNEQSSSLGGGFFDESARRIRKILNENSNPFEMMPYLWLMESIVFQCSGDSTRFRKFSGELMDSRVAKTHLNEKREISIITPDLIKTYNVLFPNTVRVSESRRIWGYGSFLTESADRIVFFSEDAAAAVAGQPANNVGDGQIAGTTAETTPGIQASILFKGGILRRKKKSNGTKAK